MAEIHQLKPKPIATNWMCSACGIDAGCNCGAPLMSKAQRAVEAIAANPRMSDRAIARKIGVDHKTVGAARDSATGEFSPVHDEPRIGLDGKQRRMPVRQPIIDEDEDEEFEPATPAELRVSFLVFANEAMLMAEYKGPIDREIIEAGKATATAWRRLVEKMEQRK